MRASQVDIHMQSISKYFEARHTLRNVDLLFDQVSGLIHQILHIPFLITLTPCLSYIYIFLLMLLFTNYYTVEFFSLFGINKIIITSCHTTVILQFLCYTISIRILSIQCAASFSTLSDCSQQTSFLFKFKV